jgi:hypothetical protein
MYTNSTSKGLHHPSFKSLVSPKEIWFPAVVRSAVQISNLNNSANLKHNSKRRVKYSKQGPEWDGLMNKTRGQKSHATVPLRMGFSLLTRG